ncbi:SRPBCC family protein [Arthrobacter sp. fls2-241-R2A-172]|uniref:SRPBCC family protein n=1 Tax=Arthrobacter sp. fls2-241-R2A-172 TaxID=3040325 RepID=UPI00254AC6F5|nr:SRPBCC family protein [Arthrobacter sp. fls2-241-R2A-172]
MTTKVNKTIMVNVPISTAYRQWTQFEEFPHFMGGVERVTRLGDDRLEWVAEIAGVHRKWEAKIVQQDVNRAVAWAAVDGVKNAGWVEFKEAGPSQTSLHLSLEYEPHGVLEFLGDKLHVIERQAESDLKKFKEYIEKQAPETASTAGTTTAAPATGTPTPATATGTAATAVGHDASATDTTPIVDPVTHPFDQTNGLADDDDADRGPGFIPPQSGWLPGQH